MTDHIIAPDNLDLLAGRQHRDMGALAGAHSLARHAVADLETGEALLHHRPDAIPYDDHTEVRKAGKSSEAFTTYVLAGAPPVSVFGANPDRKKAKISNTGMVPIVFGKRTQVTAGLGFLIPANTIFDTESQEEMFVGSTANYAGTTIAVGVYIENN